MNSSEMSIHEQREIAIQKLYAVEARISNLYQSAYDTYSEVDESALSDLAAQRDAALLDVENLHE